MKITDLKIVPVENNEHLKGYVTITFDKCLVISELKLIRVAKGYYVQMPRRKRGNGKYIDIVAPLNTATRRMIEEKVFAAYKAFANEPLKRAARK